jgi:ABC-type nitrate/sulfonate/bicarbonate transport system permease component
VLTPTQPELSQTRRPPTLQVRAPSVLVRLLQDFGLYCVGFASLFVIWYIVAVYVVRSVLFPSPIPVFARAIVLIENGVLIEQISASLQRIVVGFVIGSAIGIVIGLLIGSFRPVHKLLEPYIETLRFIPAVALITVAVIWFGIGETSKIFIITYSTVFIVTITAAAGVSGIPRNKLNAGRSLGATSFQLFLFVTLPAAVPAIITGMRVAMANAFTTIVAAELVAANNGIGAFLWKARLYMLVDDTFVALVSLAILGFTIDRCFRWASRYFAGRYSPHT